MTQLPLSTALPQARETSFALAGSTQIYGARGGDVPPTGTVTEIAARPGRGVSGASQPMDRTFQPTDVGPTDGDIGAANEVGARPIPPLKTFARIPMKVIEEINKLREEISQSNAQPGNGRLDPTPIPAQPEAIGPKDPASDTSAETAQDAENAAVISLEAESPEEQEDLGVTPDQESQSSAQRHDTMVRERAERGYAEL